MNLQVIRKEFTQNLYANFQSVQPKKPSDELPYRDSPGHLEEKLPSSMETKDTGYDSGYEADIEDNKPINERGNEK